MPGSSEGVPCDALLTPAVFGVSSSSGFRRRNLEIWGLSAANSTPIDQIDPVPPETAHPGSPIELSADRAGYSWRRSWVLWWLAVAADGIDECGWATDVQLSCRCPSWGRLAAPALVKLPSRAPSGVRALDSFWAAQCALHFHHLVPPFAGIGPAASKSLRHVFQGRTAAPCAAKSSPGGCSANALATSQQSQLEWPESRHWRSQSAR